MPKARESEMKLKDHPGFKRLAVLITLVSFIVSLIVYHYHVEDAVIAAILIAVSTFIFVRILYWVADGFRKKE